MEWLPRSHLRVSSEQVSSLLKEEAARREQLVDSQQKYTDSKLDSLAKKIKTQMEESFTGKNWYIYEDFTYDVKKNDTLNIWPQSTLVNKV